MTRHKIYVAVIGVSVVLYRYLPEYWHWIPLVVAAGFVGALYDDATDAVKRNTRNRNYYLGQGWHEGFIAGVLNYTTTIKDNPYDR